MFIDLYQNDGNDLKIRMEKMSDFFRRSEELLENSDYKGSYLFKQNSHSVSSYLFLNDPENHYMYKEFCFLDKRNRRISEYAVKNGL